MFFCLKTKEPKIQGLPGNLDKTKVWFFVRPAIGRTSHATATNLHLVLFAKFPGGQSNSPYYPQESNQSFYFFYYNSIFIVWYNV